MARCDSRGPAFCAAGAGHLWSVGRSIGGAFTAVLIYAIAATTLSNGASAAALNAQDVNAAQLPTPSGKKRASAPGAAAIIKAERKGHAWLADRIYSGVPAGVFGKEQEIEIGHYSGESNVVYWLKRRGFDPEPSLVAAVLSAAKRGNRVLTEEEVIHVVKEHRATG